MRRPRLWRAAPPGFLWVTTAAPGLILGAQLSGVQVVAFIQRLLTGFRRETFLIEPLIFMLWVFAACVGAMLVRAPRRPPAPLRRPPIF